MSNAGYDCEEARRAAVSEGIIPVATRLAYGQWSDKALFKAAVSLCACLAHDKSNIPALYEQGVVDAVVFYILREFGGQRTSDSKWWFSALQALIMDHQLSQDAVEEGGGRMLMHDVMHSSVDSPIEPDKAPKFASKSVLAAIFSGGIRGEIVERKRADQNYLTTHAECVEKIQYSRKFIDPRTFRDSLVSFRIKRERAMYSIEQAGNFCAVLRQLEEDSAAAHAQASAAKQSAALADSVKQCRVFADDASVAASAACEAAEEAAYTAIQITMVMKEAEHAAQLAHLMARLQPVVIIASSSAESAARASDNARDATIIAASAMEQFDAFKATEEQEMWAIASEVSIHICSCASALYNARQSYLHLEWALQSAEDGLTLQASSSTRIVPSRSGVLALIGQGCDERTSVMDSMAQIRAGISNLQNVRDFLARNGALRCVEECDRMLIGAASAEQRACALAVAMDVANAPYRIVQSIAASLLDALVTESYNKGEELMLEKSNKLWGLLLRKRLRKQRNDAHERVIKGMGELSRSIILEVADTAVSEAELSRVRNVVEAAKRLMAFGESLHAESQGFCAAFLECSVEAAKQCDASHGRMTSCVLELRAQMNRCVASADVLEPAGSSPEAPLGASQEVHTMWSMFSEMEDILAIVKHSYEEKALRDRLTRAGVLPAVIRSKKHPPMEPSRDAVLKQAVLTGDEQGVKTMIVQGCDVNAISTGGYTLLHEAAEHGIAKIVKLLLYEGASVSSRTVKGSTPLLTAVASGNTDAVGVILQAGADPNVRNHLGSLPLLIACLNGHAGVVHKLVAAHADCCVIDKEANTAFHLAVVSGCAEAVSHMLHLSPPDAAADTTGVVTRDPVPADVLLAAHSKNAEQRTPVSIAASLGHASIVQMLIRGAAVDVNDADVDGIAPIHLAASEGHHATIAALVDDGGAHVNKPDNHGFTALHLAILQRHERAVKCLLDRGASSNCRTKEGKTARDVAYGMRGSERLQALLNVSQGLLLTQLDSPAKGTSTSGWSVAVVNGATD